MASTGEPATGQGSTTQSGEERGFPLQGAGFRLVRSGRLDRYVMGVALDKFVRSGIPEGGHAGHRACVVSSEGSTGRGRAMPLVGFARTWHGDSGVVQQLPARDDARLTR